MDKLAEIVRRLHQAKVEFVLIGGLAAVQHGAIYTTYDVDICVPFTASNLKKIEQALQGTNPRFRQRKEIPLRITDDMLPDLKNLYILTDLGPLDCLGEVKGVGDYSSVSEQSRPAQMPFGPIQILALEPLIRAKEAIGRLQDTLVVAQLRAVQERYGTT